MERPMNEIPSWQSHNTPEETAMIPALTSDSLGIEQREPRLPVGGPSTRRVRRQRQHNQRRGRTRGSSARQDRSFHT